MHGRDLIVIGASLGGVETLPALLRQFRSNLPASVLVCLQTASERTTYLPTILERASRLPAAAACDYDNLEHGHIYVAVPDRHMLVQDGYVRLASGPREKGHRPAIDPMFRTAAVARRNRVIGVILSGMLDDGAAGLLAIKRCGGLAVVQAPEDALTPKCRCEP